MSNEFSQEEILRLINQQKIAVHRTEINYQRAVALSVQAITEDERNWIRQILSAEDSDSDPFKPSPNYVRLKKAQFEIRESKENVRKDLDTLRENMKKFTPKELIELSNKNVRESRGIKNFDGIYIIHNCVKDIYYVGQAVRVFDRAYRHFVTNPAKNEKRYEGTVEFNLPEIYDDYHLGDKFDISLIPLGDTSFSTLDDLEAYAISAYNASVEYGGYNRTHGNVITKVCFKNDSEEKAANLILNKIKGTEIFSNLKNNDDRRKYTHTLALELALPSNLNFRSNFSKSIKECQKANKKKY
ncbi:excinuclease ABC subunit C [Metabacillus rhizolycopersici]|uniref:Excinuclease ABC subunit C n=1 Tax=Metabacillus rhizolycopersici TaxID=2875709 RepID=A0ABS7UW76_9BACI|nr:excinuclease ABC subunit C [Metabacillus rhizolycopersici]MBZ5752184.1 excinuclease ABC subunit C [Metabacillus rhizolycopersici]